MMMFSYAESQRTLQRLTRRFPALERLALTETPYGRQIEALVLGSGPRRVLVSAAHHGNEAITGQALLQVLEQLLEAAARDQRLGCRSERCLLQTVTLCLVPLVNPDGADLAAGCVAPDSPLYRSALAIARQYPAIPFPTGWKANGAGVDLNLNYPAGFDRAVACKAARGFSRPAPRDYPGRAPLDQPEAAALAELTCRFAPHIALALHTQGREIYWRYGDYADPAAQNLGQQMADATGYTLCDPPAYSSNAGYKDWFVTRFRRPGYTIELGLGENPLPPAQLEPICRDLMSILPLAIIG